MTVGAHTAFTVRSRNDTASGGRGGAREAPTNGPPTRPAFARNSLVIFSFRAYERAVSDE
jgi:hypothetical protein